MDDILRIANNALYFDDNSDYEQALWEILQIVNPRAFDKESVPTLEYISD